MFCGYDFQDINDGHSVPSQSAASEFRGMMSDMIGPRLCSGFIVSVIEQTLGRIVEVARSSQNLLGCSTVRVGTIVELLSIPDQKGHGHMHAIQPQLTLVGLVVRMPEDAVRGSWISIQALPDFPRGQFVFLLLGFLIER